MSRASAAGVTWTSRTASAPWAERNAHTSVVAAAGAIYVIGGRGGTAPYYLNDVWVSTDGGAPPDSVGGAGGRADQVKHTTGGTSGVLRGTTGYQRGTTKDTTGGTAGLLGGTTGY